VKQENGFVKSLSETCATYISKKNLKRNAGVTFRELAKAHANGKAVGPGSAVDVQKKSAQVVRRLLRLKPPITAHVVTAAYFEKKEVEKEIRKAVNIVSAAIAKENDNDENLPFKDARRFLRSMLPGLSGPGVGLRVIVEGRDFLYQMRMEDEANQNRGKHEVIVDKLTAAGSNGILPRTTVLKLMKRCLPDGRTAGSVVTIHRPSTLRR